VKFHEMTGPELRSVSRTGTVVLAPIAACEQHSRHLAVWTDAVLVTAVASGLEERLSESVLLLPTQWMGASAHHLRYGGTLSAEVDTHTAMVVDLLTPLLDDGYERVLVLNGHGGNVDTMQTALRKLRPRYLHRHMTAASYWDLAANELAALAEGPRKVMGHACEFETSMMLHLRPDLVRRDQIADDPPNDDPVLRGLFTGEDMFQRTDHGAVGYPRMASAERARPSSKPQSGGRRRVVRALAATAAASLRMAAGFDVFPSSRGDACSFRKSSTPCRNKAERGRRRCPRTGGKGGPSLAACKWRWPRGRCARWSRRACRCACCKRRSSPRRGPTLSPSRREYCVRART